ncbi:MAG: hypothetical protein ACE141_12265 [Bryobacteraceae bacterium]
MNRSALFGTLICLLIAPVAPAQQKQAGTSEASRVLLGRLTDGAAVAFVRAVGGDWGIEISGAARLVQPKPAQIEVYRGGDSASQLAAGYQSVRKEADAVVALAKVSGDGEAAFSFEDRWRISGAVLSLSRKVSVAGAEAGAGFYSAIRFSTAPTVGFSDIDCLAPGLLYGDPTYDGDTSPGGVLNFRARRFSIREDLLPAPLFAMSFRDGRWAAVLDLAPRGDTVMAETGVPATTPVIDERIQFGALGARELAQGGVEFGFWLPGATEEFAGGFQQATPAPIVRRRYHPVKTGFSQSYQVGFRLGEGASFRGMQREVWRWAWQTLKPKTNPVNVEVVRRTLLDHLSDRVLTSEDRTGVPFLFDAVTGRAGSYHNVTTTPRPAGAPGGQPRRAGVQASRTELPLDEAMKLAEWAKPLGVEVDPNARELARFTRVIMGFVSKGIESADQLLQEGDRDPGPRGQKMRKQGLAIIDTFIRLVPMSPPAGEGFNLQTGKPDCGEGVVSLRAPSEDMRILMEAYRREKRQGRDHPEWLRWVVQLADWMLPQQREDGSFPRSWVAGTGEVNETSGTSSYNPVALLVRLSEETGQKRYLDAAVGAAEYVWANYGSRGVFVGGATDNPNIVDKEAGMLSLEAFLVLYEATKEPKWLERARAAADYAESWIWIWNLPMPLDADPAKLNWKPGVPTVGVQGITARAVGGVDQYMAWSVPAYVKLYKYTGDAHYLDVARVLLHDTKSMLALPGRTFDLKGPGWQQEHWRTGPNNRGVGTHRAWLPWVSVNHLRGITATEEFDPALFKQLAEGK